MLTRKVFPVIAAIAALSVPIAGAAEYDSSFDPRVDVVSGGFGKEEADTLRAQAPSFALTVICSRRADGSDEFVADVHLRIVDTQGRTVIDGNAGPIFLAQLPDGQYVLAAEYQGQTQVRNLAIASGQHQEVSLIWS